MTQKKTLILLQVFEKIFSDFCLQTDFPKSLQRAGVSEHPAGDLTKRVDPRQENSAFFKQGSFVMLLSRPPTALGELVPTQVFTARGRTQTGSVG